MINEPAMILKDNLIVSDLHIGITTDFYRNGIKIPSQALKFSDKLNKLKKPAKTRNLVIIGDLKHFVKGISRQEMYEIPLFFSSLRFRKVILIKGNHDSHIEKLVHNQEKVSIVNSYDIGKYHITHGHRVLSTKLDKIIIGHVQPYIRLVDKYAMYTLPCWVKGKLLNSGKKLIILPAFNELCGATIINRDKISGPITKNLDYSKTRIYLLDGTDLGILKDLL